MVRTRPPERAEPQGSGPQAGPEPRPGRIKAGLRQVAVRLGVVFVVGFAASIVGALAIRGLGRALLNVPNDFKPLMVPDIFPLTFAPIVGCTVGFIVAFVVKKPGPRSVHLFLTVGLKFILLDTAIAILSLPGSTSAGSIITMMLVIIFPLLILPVELRFVPRPGSNQTHSVPTAV